MFSRSKSSEDSSSQNPYTSRVTVQCTIACFLISLVLCVSAGVTMSWVHEDVNRGPEGENERKHAQATVRSQAFWYKFLIPSIVFTFVGVEIFLFSEFPVSVGMIFNACAIYVGWQMWRTFCRKVTSCRSDEEEAPCHTNSGGPEYSATVSDDNYMVRI